MARRSESRAVHIVGAGPAGLAAALTIARDGGRAIVHELRAAVGARFHGDLQGIENWTTPSDALDELARRGIEPTFDSRPCREGVLYDAQEREYVYRSREPLFYLVRRGPDAGTLDDALMRQAIERGVQIRFRDPCSHLPDGGIVAGGPRTADAIAVGYVFETDRADGVFATLSDRLAPAGYAYLLISRGRGTVASCLFDDFHRESLYLERTVEFFRRTAGLSMRAPVRFGGAGNVLFPTTARQGGILFAGEAAGFQDALWGFGMRLAMISGHLAARALLAGDELSYDRLWKREIGGWLRTSIVNRYAYRRLRDRGYVRLMRRIARAADTRDWLRRYYAPSLGKSLLFPLARLAVRSRRRAPACPRRDCDCTWCRGHEPTTARTFERPALSWTAPEEL